MAAAGGLGVAPHREQMLHLRRDQPLLLLGLQFRLRRALADERLPAEHVGR